ncbi:hypothetical protein [Runella slithyformis]|uniref:Uncharacterized protein n=1 Tax=Runella slithyformis (strain ATCC 29530 / DSM 19594 / LMG 11500 / NCIMB 11436 / LSU 4) TaxID=761193 RepID=A0A7U3ZJG2_RUNSL|nr:hypothetical protein [Runella slithyformis]AEI48362.1 hypothetical protein Runsl_1942 [Runella slithyformis DSM 19594]
MAHIAIPIPSQLGRQDIEVEVSINGQRQALHYRVELFYWNECGLPAIDRAECLRHILSQYDKDWTLYYMGSPTEQFIPITFVRKKETLLLSPFLYSLLNL